MWLNQKVIVRRGLVNRAIVAGAMVAGSMIAWSAWRPGEASAQYKIDGWPVKKTWGPIRGTYVDPVKRDLRLVFEDAAGTVRIVAIDPSAKTAVPLAEFKRE